jgi:hypothetical protein
VAIWLTILLLWAGCQALWLLLLLLLLLLLPAFWCCYAAGLVLLLPCAVNVPS